MELQEAEEITNESFREGEDSILRLNDYCLYHIFSFLRVQDLMAIEEVCTRFEELAVKIYKYFKILDFSNNILSDLNSPKAIKAASRVGPYISYIKSNNINDIVSFAKFLRKFFKNLRKIYLRDFDLKDKETIINFAIAFKGVKQVEMDTCELSDNNFKMLFQVNQLEAVKFIHIKGFIGTSLEGLTRNLREISLCCCPHVDPDLFSEFCQEHPNLKSLDIIGCKWIDEICLIAIATNLKELESLKISDSYENILYDEYIILADLPMLKHFKVVHYPSHNPADVNSLLLRISYQNRLESLIWCCLPVTPFTEAALRQLTNLKALCITGSVLGPNFRDSALKCIPKDIEYLHIHHSSVLSKNLALFVKRCTQLKLLSVIHCQYINESFINKILRYLRGRSHMLKLEFAPWQIYRKERRDLLMTHSGWNPTKLILTINYNY